MCMYAKLIEHNLVGQPEIRKANFGGDHTPYNLTSLVDFVNRTKAGNLDDFGIPTISEREVLEIIKSLLLNVATGLDVELWV